MQDVSNLSGALAGRYRIEREIGVGGMATVYLATDLRHDRRVAVKVLRPELAAVIGAERFLAEIKTTANLQHPHILPLHDSGEAAGTVFYVMPFVDGESLRDRLTRESQLPIGDAIRITTQVAAALDHAHRQHVIHRDIKPENILLADGEALVADFGIALAVSRTEGGVRMTETGMSLGTPRYMAPEQAMGEREITAKADVYALGCVLYEMLSGEPPFTGATAQAVIARAMTESPRSLVIQRRTIQRNVEAATLTALEKLPADRFASAGAFAAALVNPQYGLDASGAHTDAATRRTAARSALVLPLAAVAVTALAALGWLATRPSPPRPVTRTGLAFAPDQAPLPDRPFVLSPDGSKLMFVGPAVQVGGQLWIKARERLDAVRVPGTASVSSFTFSPDGQSIVFITPEGLVEKLLLVGGTPVQVADSAGPVRGVAWLDDGSILYAGLGGRTLRRLPAAGGKPVVVWKSDTSNAHVGEPLPGSRGALFAQCSGVACIGGASLYVLDLRTLGTRRLLAGVIGFRYVPTGHLVAVRPDGELIALPFSLRSQEITGPAVQLQEGISASTEGAALFDVSREGTLVTRSAVPGATRGKYELVWVDRAGRESRVDSTWTFRLTSSGGSASWTLSPNGTELAIGLNTDAGDDIWIKHLPHGPLSRLSFDSFPAFRPRWSPDGRSVVFLSGQSFGPVVVRRAADGTGGNEVMLRSREELNEAALSPDGKFLVVRTGGRSALAGGRDIKVVRVGVDSVPRPLIATRFDEEAFAVSPDGRWIAYESDETGRTEVFIRPFPSADGGKTQVSSDGGAAPLWARNSRELFYVNGARSMVAVPVAPGTMPQLGDPRTLFHLRSELYLSTPAYFTPFDISLDGQRFLMARQVGPAPVSATPIVMVQNWLEELTAKLARR